MKKFLNIFFIITILFICKEPVVAALTETMPDKLKQKNLPTLADKIKQMNEQEQEKKRKWEFNSLFNRTINFESFQLKNNMSTIEENMARDSLKLSEQGYLQEAINLCSKGIQKYPAQPTFYLFRAYLYMKNDNYNSALIDLNNSIKINPNASVMQYYLRGVCYDAFKDYKKSMNDLYGVIAKNNYILDKIKYDDTLTITENDNINIGRFLILCATLRVTIDYLKDEINKKENNPKYNIDYSLLKQKCNQAMEYRKILLSQGGGYYVDCCYGKCDIFEDIERELKDIQDKNDLMDRVNSY